MAKKTKKKPDNHPRSSKLVQCRNKKNYALYELYNCGKKQRQYICRQIENFDFFKFVLNNSSNLTVAVVKRKMVCVLSAHYLNIPKGSN